jgi:hypothetical protein
MDTSEKEVKRWKEAQRQGEDRVNLRISLLCQFFDKRCEKYEIFFS